MGIVLQLEEDALRQDADILVLLRKAKVAAHKLKLNEFEKWVDCELGGYGTEDTVPKYRHVRGELLAWNPYRGWIPVVSDGSVNLLKEQPVRDGIAALIDLYGTADDCLSLRFNDHINNLLNSQSGSFPTNYSIRFGKNQIKAIMEHDKTLVLEWALSLEDGGVLGEGFSFTEEERERVANSEVVQNYINF